MAPEAPARWGAFRSGLTEPSPAALAATLLVAAALAAAALLGIDAGFVAGRGAHYLARDPGDQDVLLASRALALSRRRSAEPLVLVTGSSATHESVLADALAEALAAEGRAGEVWKLTSLGQTLVPTVGIADLVPEGARGVAVIGVGPARFGHSRAQLARMARGRDSGFRSPLLDETLRDLGVDPGPRTGIYLVDHHRFVLPRIRHLAWRLLLLEPVHFRRTWFRDRPADQEWPELMRRTALPMIDRYPYNARPNLELLRTAVERLQRHEGLRVVLLEHPADPEVRAGRVRAQYERHRRNLLELEARTGAAYVDLQETLELPSEVFYDWCHLRSDEAARRFTVELARRLAPWLPEAAPARTAAS